MPESVLVCDTILRLVFIERLFGYVRRGDETAASLIADISQTQADNNKSACCAKLYRYKWIMHLR